MKCLRYLVVILLAFVTVNCSNAQTNKDEGDVIVMDKAAFLAKVYNYEKNSEEWIYEGDRPCIIDFYADWCGPCRYVAPIMKELAAEYKDNVIFYKIDVDNERELASVFGISSIPTILFVPVNDKPQAPLGALPKKTLVEQIEKILLKKEN